MSGKDPAQLRKPAGGCTRCMGVDSNCVAGGVSGQTGPIGSVDTTTFGRNGDVVDRLAAPEPAQFFPFREINSQQLEENGRREEEKQPEDQKLSVL